MRDIALSIFVFGLLPVALRYPVVGAYLWAWLSIMNPHKLTFGFAYDLPFAMLAALVTLVGFLFTRKRYALPPNSIMVVYVLLLVWMTCTSFFAVAPVDRVIDRWVFVAKIHLMIFVTIMLIRERKHVQILVWLVTFSVAIFGIKGGIWTVTTGGGGRVWGPAGSMLYGNNELAVALVMLMPFLYYFYQTVTQRWARFAILFCMVATAFSILGTQSRGALIALLAMAFFLGIKGPHPIRASLALIVVVGVAINFMPESWTERMESIGKYEADSSAMSRIWTWKTLWAAALDRPLTGVGFSADNWAVFAQYAPRGAEFEAFDGRVFVAHSIYFQTLGEHGFVGLALFLLLGFTTWRTAGRIARTQAGDSEFRAWMPALMRMVQVSLVGYAVGGAFLSLAYLDVPYYIVSYVILCDALVRQRAKAASRPAPAPAATAAGRSIQTSNRAHST